MHLLMIFISLIIAWWLRHAEIPSQGNWHLRWQCVIIRFLLPPALILTTAIAVLSMGTQGQMGGIDTDGVSYILSLAFLTFLSILWVKLAFEGSRSIHSVHQYPQIDLTGKQVRLLETEALFAGQVGFWRPELVVSQGLLQTLSPGHLESVLAHEEGHYHYRDTFWFFWLGWVRSSTIWLPNTEFLWEELLVLRELRADSYAAVQVDPLILAESLLLVVSSNPVASRICCAALGTSNSVTVTCRKHRLQQRIEALLAPLDSSGQVPDAYWCIFLLVFLPMLSILFHN
jgi:hypothetical protein